MTEMLTGPAAPTDPTTPTAATDLADAVADRLRIGETTWAATSLTRRRELLGEVRALAARHAQEWVDTACRIKSLPSSSPLVGEEWISGPWALLSYLHALDETLAALERGGDVLDGFRVRDVPGDRLGVDVLPHGVFDRLLLMGYRATVWTRPGVTRDELNRTAGLAQRNPSRTNGPCVVLGAGNITSIAPLDVLYALFADNRPVVLKLNPVTDPLLGVFEAVFAPLRDLNVVVVLTGDPDVAAALIEHPAIAAVHMTGSEATHDAIVWGQGEQGAANKAAGTPRMTKPISSELGGVSPVVVVPGRWSRGDMRRQARHVATMRLHNGGSNCVATQLVILSSDWAQKDEFLAQLRRAMADAYPRTAWYPGSGSRVGDARRRHPSAQAVGGTPDRTLIPGLDLRDDAETAFRQEWFAPVLATAEISGTGIDFLRAAVAASNDRLRGTLGANVLIHPRDRRAMGNTFDRAIADLRYGTIGINAWNAVGYLTARATWGAFPGHRLDDVQSGRGVVHNALLLDGTERTVVQGWFRPIPTPPWFVHNRTAATTGRRLTRFQARPRWRALPGIFVAALRG